jgi:hypothetical protein
MDPLRNYAQMSIGEIAMVLYKSEPEAMGQVTNLSLGGVAFGGSYTGTPDDENIQLDLLMAEQGLYLHNIPYATVRMHPDKKGKKKPPPLRTNAFSFKNLDTQNKGRLRELLTHHVGSFFAMGPQSEKPPKKVKS